MNNIRKRIGALVLALSMVFAMVPSTVFAPKNTPDTSTTTESSAQPVMTITKISDDVDDPSVPAVTRAMDDVQIGGVLEPGGVVSGTFKLTGWFGNDFTVIACAANTGGSLSLAFVSARYDVPCDGVSRVLCRETGWSMGTYSYALSNPTSNRVAYSMMIYEP